MQGLGDSLTVVQDHQSKEGLGGVHSRMWVRETDASHEGHSCFFPLLLESCEWNLTKLSTATSLHTSHPYPFCY